MSTSTNSYTSYEVSFKSHLRLLSTSLFYALVYIIGICIFCISQFENYNVWIWFSTVMIIILIAPAIYLHCNYFAQSKNVILKVYDEPRIVLFIDNRKLTTIDYTNILSVEIYITQTKMKLDYQASLGFPIEDYNYLKFVTKNEVIVVNNLIYPNLIALAAKFTDAKQTHHITVFAKP